MVRRCWPSSGRAFRRRPRRRRSRVRRLAAGDGLVQSVEEVLADLVDPGVSASLGVVALDERDLDARDRRRLLVGARRTSRRRTSGSPHQVASSTRTQVRDRRTSASRRGSRRGRAGPRSGSAAFGRRVVLQEHVARADRDVRPVPVAVEDAAPLDLEDGVAESAVVAAAEQREVRDRVDIVRRSASPSRREQSRESSLQRRERSPRDVAWRATVVDRARMRLRASPVELRSRAPGRSVEPEPFRPLLGPVQPLGVLRVDVLERPPRVACASKEIPLG